MKIYGLIFNFSTHVCAQMSSLFLHLHKTNAMYLKERIKNTNSLSIALYTYHLTGRLPPLLTTPKRKRRKPSLKQKEKEESSAAAPQQNLRLSKTSSAKTSALATPSISVWGRTVHYGSTPFQSRGAIGCVSATFICYKRVRKKAQEPKRANRNSPKLYLPNEYLPPVITNQQDDTTADDVESLHRDSIIPTHEFLPLKDLMREKFGTDNFLEVKGTKWIHC